jgi:hypothetical protein
MLRLRRASLLAGLLACLLTPVSLAGAQTPVAEPSGGGWWTAWSSCDITPVRSGPTPPGIPGMADDILWLAGETTNDSDIEMIVWLWTGNRPLPLNGQYASDGTSTKWLWAFSEEMQDLTVTATNENGTEGEVQIAGEIIDSSTGPINGWPSGVILPEPGCWTFEVTATALDGDVYEGRVVFPAVP